MKTLEQRLELIKPKITSGAFLGGTGLGNEINFWIFDYPPESEMTVRAFTERLVTETAKETGVIIEVFDLFDMMINYLKERGYFEKVLKLEREKGSAAVINPIKKTLRLTLTSDVIVGEIAASKADVIFITGVGKAFPVIRSHTVLNNLHGKIENKPVVMFFPGEYDAELRLFGTITDDNYYRAFKLIEN
jgi:hypothetical protein